MVGEAITGGTKKDGFQVQATATYSAGTGFLADSILCVTSSVGTVVATVDNWNDDPEAGYDTFFYITSYINELRNLVML